MLRLTYKQNRLITFINNYRKYVKLDVKNEFETKEELDLYIKENYNKAKMNYASSKANMGYYRDTKYGRLGREIAYGRAMHTGKCITKKIKID